MSTTHLQDVLVQSRAVTPHQICHAVAAAHRTEFTWLELLLLWQLVDEHVVAAQAHQAARVPRCDLDHLAGLCHHVLSLIPPDVAVEHRVVPMGLDPNGDLRVAMVDPTDEAAIEEIEFFCDRRVLREVAPARAIAWALHTYYRTDSPLWPPHKYDAATVSGAAASAAAPRPQLMAA